MTLLYHTSNMIVSAPDVFHSREHLDFGKGFYLTPLREQADTPKRTGRKIRPALLTQRRRGYHEHLRI